MQRPLEGVDTPQVSGSADEAVGRLRAEAGEGRETTGSVPTCPVWWARGLAWAPLGTPQGSTTASWKRLLIRLCWGTPGCEGDVLCDRGEVLTRAG